MITISLCMIVKNEEDVLARCLDSVDGIADEIIIVDTGSTDRTVEIARTYTDKVRHFTWIDDFSAARNESFSHASMQYILWLDADDVIDAENRAAFLRLKAEFPQEVDVAMFPYRVAFDDFGNCTFHYYRERLLRRSGGYRWSEPVHECIQLYGNIRQFDVAVTHGDKARAPAGARNLDIYRKLEREGKPFSTRARCYYARELKNHAFFEEAVEQYRLFFAGDGWVEDKITASGDLADCLRALGRKQEALEALCRSFAYSPPRAEICCQLGRIHLREERLDEAAFWYELALTLPRPDGWGFVTEDAWGFLPHIQLCLLCERMGKREQALRHHLAAREFKPDDPSVLHNQRYFEGLGLLTP